MTDKDDVEKIIDELILSGGLEVSGIDVDSGEILYGFTDKLKEVSPEIANGLSELFHMHVMALWEKGFLDLNPMEENPLVRLTNFAYDDAALASLHPELRQTLKIIIVKFEEQGEYN